MNNYLFSLLAQQLQRNRTWIDIEKPELRYEFYSGCGGALKPGLFRVMKLVCRKPRYGYHVGKFWLVPEFDIDKAIRKLCADADFKRRMDQGIMTTTDAERIINIATYGIIDADLEPI